jgi:hypothetical protein
MPLYTAKRWKMDSVNRHAPAGSFLVHDRFAGAMFMAGQLDHQVAMLVDADPAVVEGHPDLPRIRAGRDDPVVFEDAVFSVVDQVDAGIHAGVPDLSVVGYSGAPPAWIIADEVVGLGCLPVFARDLRRGVRTDPSGAQWRLSAVGEDALRAGQVQSKRTASGEEMKDGAAARVVNTVRKTELAFCSGSAAVRKTAMLNPDHS